MSVLKNVLTGTLVGAGVIALFRFLTRMNQVQGNLEIVPKASLQKLSLDGLTIRLDIMMKNPTKGDFTIKFPFVKLIYKGTTIGSSQLINRDIHVPQYGQAVIEKMMIDIPLENVFSVTSTI